MKIMKKFLICFSIIYLLAILTGCGNNFGIKYTSDSSNEGVGMENNMIHFAIADSEGNSVAVEYIDNEMIVTETPVLTNFYLAEGDKNGVGTQQSHIRFEILTKTLEENPDMTIPEVRDAFDSVSKDNFNEYESTEWSIIFDQSALTATYYHREDYETDYSFKLNKLCRT